MNNSTEQYDNASLHDGLNVTIDIDEYTQTLLRVEKINQIANCVFIFLCAPFILAGNIMVVISVIKFKKLHTVMNKFVTSLALADFLVGFPTIPFYIVFYIDRDMDESKYMCLLKYFCVLISLPASILNLLIVTIDRYIAIIYPLQYISWMTSFRVRVMITLVWVYSFSTAVMPLLGVNTWTKEKGCNFWSILPKPFTMIVVPIVITLCLPSNVFMYIRIFQEARNSKKRMLKYRSECNYNYSKYQRELRRAKVMAFVFLLFVAFWFPFFTASLLKYSTVHPLIAEMVKQWSLSLSMANSIVNPILYCWIRPEFRQAYKLLLGITESERTKKYLESTSSNNTKKQISTITPVGSENGKEEISYKMSGCSDEGIYLK